MKDLQQCEGGKDRNNEMRLIPRTRDAAEDNVLRNKRWNRGDAFCIDRFEFPNVKGGMPQANVTYLQADEACRAKNKTLCLKQDWTNACQGDKDFTTMWPYGKIGNDQTCNTKSNAPLASGSMA